MLKKVSASINKFLYAWFIKRVQSKFIVFIKWYVFCHDLYIELNRVNSQDFPPSPADLDELAVDRLQRGFVPHCGSVLQRLLSHLLLPLQPLLDHAEAAAGPSLLPALRHHTCSSAAAQVHFG